MLDCGALSHALLRFILAAQSLSLFAAMVAWSRTHQFVSSHRVKLAAFFTALAFGVGAVTIAVFLMWTTSK
jgi:hypothetical protein